MRIAVVTGARSDYGLMVGVLRLLWSRPDIKLQLLVTGMHLSRAFGSTENVIREDGFDIAARVNMLLASDEAAGVGKSIGLGVISFIDVLTSLKPDVILLFGDRFETFAAAQAAMVLRIPIAHVHGGEVTEGAVDEQMRHCISKMAHVHFVSAGTHRERLIRMGEQPSSVHVVGAPGLDNFVSFSAISREDLGRRLGKIIKARLFLTTYHPATLGDLAPEYAFGQLTNALARFPDATCLMTMPNADAGGRALAEAATEFERLNADRVILVTSLGQALYPSALALADVVIGNSSSGLIEAPAVGTPTVNIGDRQKGRLRGQTVIDCPEQADAIEESIRLALSPSMQELASKKISPYGEPGTISKRIVDILTHLDTAACRRKAFFDGSSSS